MMVENWITKHLPNFANVPLHEFKLGKAPKRLLRTLDSVVPVSITGWRNIGREGWITCVLVSAEGVLASLMVVRCDGFIGRSR